MKKLGLLLLGAVLFGLALSDMQPAQADCGKLPIVYYSWPSPPPPPPRPPRPRWECGHAYLPPRPPMYRPPIPPRPNFPSRPQVSQNNGFGANNSSINSTMQNAGRDAINVTTVNNNTIINLPSPAGSSNGYGQSSSITDWNPYDANSTGQINWRQFLLNDYNSGNAVNTGFAYGPDDSFKERNQQGIIAWNGFTDERGEEILILSTNEQSTAPSGSAMLSVLPLPGEPVSIDRANLQSFVAAKAIMQEKLAKDAGLSSEFGVVLETKIGSHNIFVWEVESADDFTGKVQSYIADKYENKAAAVISENTLEVINRYLEEGFQYFAFDLTLVEKDMSTKEAIAYRFKSPYAYFPLRISKVGGTGDTKVDLVVFTPCEKMGFTQRSSVKSSFPGLLIMGPVEFTLDELDSIDESLDEVFDSSQKILGRNFVFRADNIDSFKNDFEIVGK